MASLSNLLGGGTTVDHRKEGLPLFGLFGSTSDMNTHMVFRVFDSGFKMCGSPWGAVCNSTTCLLYTSPSPRDRTRSRMPSSA